MRTHYLLLFVFMLLSLSVFSQADCGEPDVYCMNGGSITACSGTLVDAGGAGDVSEIVTTAIFPGTSGQKISLEFTAFDLGEETQAILYIYDGLNDQASLIGTYSGTELLGLTIAAGDDNPYGTLFLQLVVANGQSVPGFEAIISCTAGCDYGTPVLEYNNTIETENGLALFCAPGEVQVDASTSLPPDGYSIDSYTFVFGDGSTLTQSSPVYSHTYHSGGVFMPQLIIHAGNGCSGLFNAQALVVSNEPQFSFGDELLICAGYDGHMVMDVEFESAALNQSISNSETIWLEDGSLVSYTSPIHASGFPDGLTVSDCNEIASVNIKIEHSYVGDLSIELICPDGNSATILEYPNSFVSGDFGDPVVESTEGIPGLGYEYHFVPPGSGFPTLEDFAVGDDYDLFHTPAGTYDLFECNLEGCPLNGTWLLEITDYTALDDGFLFGWSIDFNLNLGQDEVLYNPVYGMGADSSYWSGNGILWMSADADSIQLDFNTLANYDLSYTLITHDGCEYTQEIEVEIDDFHIEADAGDDITYGIGSNIIEGAVSVSGGSICAGGVIDEFCYEDDAVQYFNFCSQDLFGCEGSVFMTIITGEIEQAFDLLNIYDGPDNTGPLLFSGDGNLAGMNFVGSSGCITLEIIADSSVSSCTDDDLMPFELYVTAEQAFYFEWIPPTGLTAPNSLTTGLDLFTAQSEYVLYADFPNALGCAASDTVNVVLPEAFITGFIFYDTNENGIYDEAELPLAYFPGIVNQNLDYTMSDSEGNIQLFAVGGTNTVTITSDTLMWTATTPTSYEINVDFEGEPEPLMFGYVASPNASPVIELTTNLEINNCNINSSHSVNLFNNSSVQASGYVAITVPNEVLILPEMMDEDSIVGNTIYFGFENLNFFQQVNFQIAIQNPGVEFIGQWLEFTTQVYLFDSDTDQYVFHREDVEGYYLNCAYDPNDIQEHTGLGDEGFVEANQRLHYTIRFQNTGTAPATNVFVVDSLPDLLLPQSFQPAGHSHDYTLHIDPDGVASFFFENINLPDSTSDLEGSQGFVSFYIDQQPDLAAGTMWQNKAEIYFDLNPPIVTNYAVNTIWDCETAEVTITETFETIDGVSYVFIDAYPPSPYMVWTVEEYGDFPEDYVFLNGTTGPQLILVDPELIYGVFTAMVSLELHEECSIEGFSNYSIWSVGEQIQGSVSLSPNPVLKNQNTQVISADRVNSYTIYDSKGGLQLSMQVADSDNQITLNGLSGGLYTILVNFENGTTRTARLVIQ